MTSDADVVITQPGVYDIPANVYHSDPVPGGSLSSSGARLLLAPSCPAKFKHAIDHGRPEKRAFDFGHAAHSKVLGVGEPIVVIDAASYSTKAAKEARDAAYADGHVPLLAHENEQVDAMAAVLREHPQAGPLFAPGRGIAEQSLFWQDPQTGVWLRAMVDWMLPAGPGQRLIVVDYKSCISADPAAIAKSFDSYGYYRQAPYYLAGAKTLGLHQGQEPAFVFVFQEKTAPYLITIVQPDPDSLMWGERDNRLAINTYAQCKATGHWPGYADDVLPVSLPTWTVRRHEDAWAAGDYDLKEITAA